MLLSHYKQRMEAVEQVYCGVPPEEENKGYVNKMRDILSAYPCMGVPAHPSMITERVYLGSSANAENIPLLKKLGINFILNCDGGRYIRFRQLRDKYGAEESIKSYQELPAEDREDFDMLPCFQKANGFIDYALRCNGNVLIYCPGVSRSGAIALSFLLHRGIPLLEGTTKLKDLRRVVLTNVGFMEQLVDYARSRGLLESSSDAFSSPNYFSASNTYRLKYSHLPSKYNL